MKRVRLFPWVTCLIPAMLVAGCNLDSFAPLGDLHPPLGLEAVSSNRTVFLSFWAMNDEDFFSGYNIFMGSTAEAVHSGATPLSGIFGNAPTIRQPTFTKAMRFTFVVSNDPASNTLVPGATWFFGVTAYDARNATNSRLAERIPVTIVD